MPNQKISELTTATNPSVNDVLPIVNGGATKKITAASLMSNTLSASIISLSGVSLGMGINLLTKSFGGTPLTSGLSIHNALGQIAIGDSSTGRTFRNVGPYRNLTDFKTNIFIGAAAGLGVSKGVYGAYPLGNIAIGTRAGKYLGGDDDCSCSGRKCSNQANTIVGNYAGYRLCASGLYASQKNVILGDNSLRSVQNRADGNVSIGHSAGKYLTCAFGNVIIGYRAAGSNSVGWNSSIPVGNVIIGLCAGQTSHCNSCDNVMIGCYANVSTNKCRSVAIGSRAFAYHSNAVSIGGCTIARNPGDVIVGYRSYTKNSGGHQIVIGRDNCFISSDAGSPLSGAIVLGSCNQNISTSFVLGSPMFPLSARVDTTLSGQVSSLFVTINGVNRRIPILS
jgi:hypothetical protein